MRLTTDLHLALKIRMGRAILAHMPVWHGDKFPHLLSVFIFDLNCVRRGEEESEQDTFGVGVGVVHTLRTDVGIVQVLYE
jgi:hypothetical protein